MWPYTVCKDYASRNSKFGAVKLTRNTNFEKYKYSGYGIGFDGPGHFLLSVGSGLVKNVIIFGTDIILSVHINNKNKYVLVPSNS